MPPAAAQIVLEGLVASTKVVDLSLNGCCLAMSPVTPRGEVLKVKIMAGGQYFDGTAIGINRVIAKGGDTYALAPGVESLLARRSMTLPPSVVRPTQRRQSASSAASVRLS